MRGTYIWVTSHHNPISKGANFKNRVLKASFTDFTYDPDFKVAIMSLTDYPVIRVTHWDNKEEN